jgi:hypothetical protein
MAWEYSEKTKQLFMDAVHGKPGTHLGEIEDPDGLGEHGSIICGDAMRFTFRVKRHPTDPTRDVIVAARYLTFGCTSAIAASDLLSGLGVVHGSGWGMLIFGLALVALALIRACAGRKPRATVVVGILLAIWGGAGVAADNLNFSIDRLLGPALIVLLGLWLVLRSGRGRS